jgi:hypothetical protein
MNNQTTQPDTDLATADSYDAHLIPAETAARKDREGDDFKKIPADNEKADGFHTAGGHTVDTEGLANNYAIEPEIYSETPGDMPNQSPSPASANYTIVDVFPSAVEAEAIASKMKKAGLDTHKISILGQGYQDTEHVQGKLNWKDIARAEGLASVLVGLGISSDEALKYEAEVKAGKFLVLVLGLSQDIIQANQILHEIGHRTLAEVGA